MPTKISIEMSEFTNHKAERTEKLLELFLLVIQEELTSGKVIEYREIIDHTCPVDVISVVDRLVKLNIPMTQLKKGINKAMNLVHKSLKDFQYTAPIPDSFLDLLIQDNLHIDQLLKLIRPLLKEINLNPANHLVRIDLLDKFSELNKIDLHYQIKENILFPLIEKYLPDHRCLQVMWSFHDDIRDKLRSVVQLLENPDFDLKKFNRLTGDLFFTIYAIIFREERIVFPIISGVIPEGEINQLVRESLEIGFSFIQPEILSQEKLIVPFEFQNEIDLKTGQLSAEQIRLIFNHLPVDITYVDENNRVKFFSTPEKRIFRRTNSIIGRDIKNCHPPESVHVVEEIVEAFRKGEKDKASFWIRMKGEFILIQYFAIRDEQGIYKGVVEVSQEISEIRNIQGEKRLLNWTN